MKRLKSILKQSAPTILCFLASAGVVGTAIMAAKETPKAIKLRDEAKKDRLDKAETFLYVAPAYIPAAGIGLWTIICIFGVNILNKRQQASLVSAFTLMERSYREYRSKVAEMLGSDKEVWEEIAKDHISETDVEDGKELFFEPVSGTRFNRTMAEIKDAEYQFNRLFVLRGYASFNEMCEIFNIDKIKGGDDIGWDIDSGLCVYGYQWVDFIEEKVTLDDGLECWLISYPFWPHKLFEDEDIY